MKLDNENLLFLAEFASFCERTGASFYYTTDDDGITVCRNGKPVFCDFLREDTVGTLCAAIRAAR